MRGLGTIECFLLTAHSKSCSEQEILGLPGLLKKICPKKLLYILLKSFSFISVNQGIELHSVH